MTTLLKRLLKLAFVYRSWMVLAAVMGFLTVGSGIGLMMTSAYIIARAALHPSIAELQLGIVGVRFFGIARGVFRYLERYISHEVTFRLLAGFRVWFYKAVYPLAPARLQKYQSGDLLTRIVADIESLEHIYVRVIAPPVTAIAISILMWLLFGIFNIAFSFLLIFFFIAGGLGVPAFIRFLSKIYGPQLITLRSQLNIMAVDGIQGMAELLAFGRAGDHLRAYHKLNERYIRLQRRMALIESMHGAFIGLIMNITVVAILIVAIPIVNTSDLSGWYLALLVTGTMAAFEVISPLPAAAQHLDNSLKAAARLFEVTDAHPAVPAEISGPNYPEKFDIVMDNVSFRYDSENLYVFKELTFHIRERTATAIVGPSGVGKSTVVNMLMRFWDYQGGRITIGGVNLRQIRPESARTYFAVVSQQTHLFNGTFYDNLILGNPNAGKDRIEDCCQQVGISGFINNLPDGYDTWIGEQGLQLSEGQRQRLAIARALLKKSPVLIFDEPTANLDMLTEQKILQLIWKIASEKTVILLTHRLVQLENVDKILVLNNGRVIEQGSHEQLLKKKGYYFRLNMSRKAHLGTFAKV